MPENTTETNPVKSNIPEKFEVTRNGITLTYVKQAAKRKGKGGVTLPPTFAPVIPAIKEKLEEYMTFIGEELFFEDINTVIYQRAQKQQQRKTPDGKDDSVWSRDRLMFDRDTAIERAVNEGVKTEKMDSLVQEMRDIISEFVEARNNGDTKRIDELAGLMQENLAKQTAIKKG